MSDGTDNEKKKPSGFTFFQSYEEYARTVADDKLRLSFYEMLCAYAFEGVVPREGHPHRAVFFLMRPSIDLSLARSAAGARGGRNGRGVSRNVGNQNASKIKAANRNKTKAKQKQNKRDKDKEKDKDKDKDNAIINDCAVNARDSFCTEGCGDLGGNPSLTATSPAADGDTPTLDAILRVCSNDDCSNPGGKTIPAEFGRYFYETMEGMGWQQTNGRRVTRRNFRPFLFTWWRRADESEWRGSGDASASGGDPALAAQARRDMDEARRLREQLTGGTK